MTSSSGHAPRSRASLWRRRRTFILPLVIFAALAGGCGDSAKDPGASVAKAANATPTATADSVTAARAHAEDLARDGKYVASIAAYKSAGLDADADRVRRRGARALYRSARRALAGGRYTSARRLATRSRQLRKTAGAGTVLSSANTKIAAAKAAEHERRRLAQIALDARTCTSPEKGTVRNGGGTPAGCATYASDLAARRAQREAEEAEAAPDAGGNCDPNYTGACLKPDSPDYDCEGGSGDGPDYTGAVESIGSDPYDLDRDGDGAACEG